MLPKILAEFIITGINLSPDEMTEAIGVIPTRTWRIGESIQGTALQRKHNGWCLSTGYQHDLDLGKYVKELLRNLLPKIELITAFCNKYDLHCELACAIYLDEQNPIVNFDEEVVSILAKLNASIDIDII